MKKLPRDIFQYRYPPETPTETMEFLARSWSLSASELSKAISDVFLPPSFDKQSNSSHSPTGSPRNYENPKVTFTGNKVSFYMNSSWQVVIKMKSANMGKTFVKKKKCVVKDVCPDVPAWLGRDVGDGSNRRAYFGIKIPERIIEFECKNKSEKQTWTEGIQHMLNFHSNMNIAMTV